MYKFTVFANSLVDRRRFDADSNPNPYPTFHFDADPDSDPDPTTSYTHVENHNLLPFIHGSPLYTVSTFLVNIIGARIFNNLDYMERLDQGQLHPNLEVPRLTCPGRESDPRGKRHSRKEPSEQLVAIRNSYISARECCDNYMLKISIRQRIRIH
jgi:hypothetical protein